MVLKEIYFVYVNIKKKYKRNVEIIILTLIKNGFYEAELKKIGIKVFSLDINPQINFLEITKKKS